MTHTYITMIKDTLFNVYGQMINMQIEEYSNTLSCMGWRIPSCPNIEKRAERMPDITVKTTKILKTQVTFMSSRMVKNK